MVNLDFFIHIVIFLIVNELIIYTIQKFTILFLQEFDSLATTNKKELQQLQIEKKGKQVGRFTED